MVFPDSEGKADGDGGGASAAARTRGRGENPPPRRRDGRDRMSREIRHPRHRDAEGRGGHVGADARWRRARGAFPAETSRGVLGNDRAETYRLTRTVPWPRRGRHGPSPARLPSRRARFAGSRGHPRQRFPTSHGTPDRRERRAESSGAARACGGPCACGALARARAGRTPRGGRRRHTRGCGRQAHRVVEPTIKVAFRHLPAGRAEGSGVWVSNPERSSAERARHDCERVEMSDAPVLEMRGAK